MKSGDHEAEGAHPLWYHGGNLRAATSLFPNAPKPWIDLSTGINPLPFPVGDLPASAWSRLPEAADIDSLEAVARRAYGVQPSDGIVAAPGTQALIQWLPRLFPVRRTGILGFTYREHETCWHEAGTEVTTVTALAELAGFDIGVVVNPNNPDGRIVAPECLAELACLMAQDGRRLIVDEAFMDLEGQQPSLVPRLPSQGAIVLRSFGKAYGLAGLRLGFAIAPPDDCDRLRRAMGPWAVSGPAIEIGRRALADDSWRMGAAAWLDRAGSRLDRILHRAGFHVVGGTALFRLARHDHADVIFERLCRAGILARPFTSRRNLLRFGIPHREEDWARITSALCASQGG